MESVSSVQSPLAGQDWVEVWCLHVCAVCGQGNGWLPHKLHVMSGSLLWINPHACPTTKQACIMCAGYVPSAVEKMSYKLISLSFYFFFVQVLLVLSVSDVEPNLYIDKWRTYFGVAWSFALLRVGTHDGFLYFFLYFLRLVHLLACFLLLSHRLHTTSGCRHSLFWVVWLSWVCSVRRWSWSEDTKSAGPLMAWANDSVMSHTGKHITEDTHSSATLWQETELYMLYA